jgi:transposase
MLGGRTVKQIYDLKAEGHSIRGIAERLGIARNTVRTYLRASEIPRAKPRAKRPSQLEPYRAYMHQRLSDGLTNCVVLLRELRERGYSGGYTILKDYVQPLRSRPSIKPTVRFETAPGEQAQVDWGRFTYRTPEGRTVGLWGFVLVLSWSRALYVEFVRQADEATFLRCHLHAFAALGGVPRRCLYDNTKVVVLGRDEAGEPIWNARFADFAHRLGFTAQLCRPYRAQTKGRVESGVKYVRGNFWPSVRFSDDADLNQQVQTWLETVAHQRLHGTTHERPADRLVQERSHLLALPAPERLAPFQRVPRLVGRDGFVAFAGARYGVPWTWAGQRVQVQADATMVQLWAGEERLAVHPRATRRGQRLVVPGQWAGLSQGGDDRPTKDALAVQTPTVEVEQRALAVYDALLDVAAGGGD